MMVRWSIRSWICRETVGILNEVPSALPAQLR